MGEPFEVSREQARELDRRAIEDYGIPSVVLMESAGRACADAVQQMLVAAQSVLVLIGPGNNGGDGLVIARTLHNRDVAVEVLFVGPPERLDAGSTDFATNLRLWRRLNREVPVAADPEAVEAQLVARLSAKPLVVDALFGTGLTRPLGEPQRNVVERVNAAGLAVLAVDLPSGLDADTGAVLGAAVQATRTVTFVGVKPGFRRGDGPALCGEVSVAEIGIPRHLWERS